MFNISVVFFTKALGYAKLSKTDSVFIDTLNYILISFFLFNEFCWVWALSGA